MKIHRIDEIKPSFIHNIFQILNFFSVTKRYAHGALYQMVKKQKSKSGNKAQANTFPKSNTFNNQEHPSEFPTHSQKSDSKYFPKSKFLRECGSTPTSHIDQKVPTKIQDSNKVI